MFKPISFFLLGVTLPLSLMTGFDLGANSSNEQEYEPRLDKNYVKIVDEVQRPFIYVSTKAKRTVVQLMVECAASAQPNLHGWPFDDEFFNQFFGKRAPQEQRSRMSLGTGFFVSPDGYILTNYHVVKNAKSIKVSFLDQVESELPAEFIGGDPRTDVAVIKVDVQNHECLTFADDASVEVGQCVIAAGNPFELTTSITMGVVSAKNRNNLKITDMGDFIQTDAAINPGNSGGPLLNLYGEVVGMNTAILSNSGGYMGVGFAIPSSICQNIMYQLKKDGQVRWGYLGVSMQFIDADLAEAFGTTKGALIASVLKNSPAEKAGLLTGDVILGIDKKAINSPQELEAAVRLKAPGKEIELRVLRDKKEISVKATIVDHISVEVGDGYDSRLGIHVEPANQGTLQRYAHAVLDAEGVVVKSIDDNSPLKGKVQVGYLISQVNNKKIRTAEDFFEAMKSSDSQMATLLMLSQRGQYLFVSIPPSVKAGKK
ncbi:MAG: trypsin-like peptidase domain-containing protein [Chlamydiia bacterium]